MRVNFALKYSIRGYSQKSHQKKRVEEIKLPKFNKLVEIRPRDGNGNEKIIIKKGKFIDQTSRLLIFKSTSKAKYQEAFLKTDIQLGIYIYKYINQ